MKIHVHSPPLQTKCPLTSHANTCSTPDMQSNVFLQAMQTHVHSPAKQTHVLLPAMQTHVTSSAMQTHVFFPVK